MWGLGWWWGVFLGRVGGRWSWDCTFHNVHLIVCGCLKRFDAALTATSLGMQYFSMLAKWARALMASTNTTGAAGACVMGCLMRFGLPIMCTSRTQANCREDEWRIVSRGWVGSRDLRVGLGWVGLGWVGLG